MKKLVYIFILIAISLSAEEIVLCKDYNKISKNILGQTRPMNLMIKSLEGYEFPEKIEKSNQVFAKMPSVEVLAKNGVDLVVLWNSKGDFFNIAKRLDEIGIDSCSLDLSTIEKYIDAYKILGKLLDKEERANDLSKFIEKRVAFIKKTQKIIPNEKKLTIYHAKGEDGLLTNCRNSPHSELIEFVGGINPVTCDSLKKQRVKINYEKLLLLNPDVIITDNKQFYKKVYKSKKYSFLKAVKDNKVFMIPKKPINWMDNPPSFFKIMGALWLAQNVYPNIYNIDMNEEKKEFFKLFLSRNN